MGLQFDVDPQTLRLPTSMWSGAVPAKLARQISLFGTSVRGMPPVFVHEDPNGYFVIMDGVTRATRVAKLLPGQLIRVELIGHERVSVAKYPTVADRLP